jgi:hypothetical protein
MPTAAIAAFSSSDSNHSSVNSTVDIDIARITPNMSLPPRRRSVQCQLRQRPAFRQADVRQARHRRAVRRIEERGGAS